MLGAIVGDIVGSVYEWNNIKTKDFPLFRKDRFFTDDTVISNRWVCEFVSETLETFWRKFFKSWIVHLIWQFKTKE